MNLNNEEAKKFLTASELGLRNKNELKDFREFFCGYGAAFINICITFPINKLIFRQMAYGLNTSSAFQQIKKEGYKFLYRGVLPPLMQKTLSVSIMFGTYQQFYRLLDIHFPYLASYPTLKLSVASLLAGCSEAVLTPFERVQMLLQDRNYHYKFENTFQTFKALKIYGLKEYYRGLTPILLRNGPSNVLFFSLRKEIKDVIPSSHNFFTKLMIDFLSGAVIGALISTLFYPLNVIRTKMQTAKIGSEFISIKNAAQVVYLEREKNIAKIYYGVHVNYTRALVSWGIINASYELISKIIY